MAEGRGELDAALIVLRERGHRTEGPHSLDARVVVVVDGVLMPAYKAILLARGVVTLQEIADFAGIIERRTKPR